MAAITVSCTPGGEDDNCYVTLQEAHGYFDRSLRKGPWRRWAENTDLVSTALVQATAAIEQLGESKSSTSPARLRFRGTPYSSSQALHFPRVGDTDLEGNVLIPQTLKDAVCEQAYWLLEADERPPLIDRQAAQEAGVTDVAAHGIAETYRLTDVPFGVAPRAWRLVRSLLRTTFPTTM